MNRGSLFSQSGFGYRIRSFVSEWLLPPSLNSRLKRGLFPTLGPLSVKVLNPILDTGPPESNLSSLRFSDFVELHWVSPEKCVSGTGATFNARQHHYVRYLSSGVEDFRRYYNLRAPRDAFEVLFAEAPSDYSGKHDGIWRKPWEMSESKIQPDGARERNQEWGPISDRKLGTEARRLSNLAQSVSRKGYVADFDDWDAFPIYQLMIDDSDPTLETYRLKISGSHRFAVLVHLGWQKIPVRPTPLAPREVRLSDLRKWPGVVEGKFSEEEARFFFSRYFRAETANLLKGW